MGTKIANRHGIAVRDLQNLCSPFTNWQRILKGRHISSRQQLSLICTKKTAGSKDEPRTGSFIISYINTKASYLLDVHFFDFTHRTEYALEGSHTHPLYFIVTLYSSKFKKLKQRSEPIFLVQ